MLDKDLQEAVKKKLERNNIEVLMNTPSKSVEACEGSTPEKPKVRVDTGEKVFECDALLSATGRHGNTGGLGLEALESQGLKIGRGRLIEVDQNCWTGCGKIY